MIFFIVFLRFLAACLITNAHYTGGIYPTEIIANGGLLGDVIFFCCFRVLPLQHKILVSSLVW